MNLHKSIAVAKAGRENTRKDGYTRFDSRNSINAAVDLKEDLTDDLSSLNIFRKKNKYERSALLRFGKKMAADTVKPDGRSLRVPHV